MKVPHAIKVLKNLPGDWPIMWGDSKMILHNIATVKCNLKNYNTTEIILFNKNGCTAYNSEVLTQSLISKLFIMPQDSELVFREFGETKYLSYFDIGDTFLKIKGFRRAKYTD